MLTAPPLMIRTRSHSPRVRYWISLTSRESGGKQRKPTGQWELHRQITSNSYKNFPHQARVTIGHLFTTPYANHFKFNSYGRRYLAPIFTSCLFASQTPPLFTNPSVSYFPVYLPICSLDTTSTTHDRSSHQALDRTYSACSSHITLILQVHSVEWVLKQNVYSYVLVVLLLHNVDMRKHYIYNRKIKTDAEPGVLTAPSSTPTSKHDQFIGTFLSSSTPLL